MTHKHLPRRSLRPERFMHDKLIHKHTRTYTTNILAYPDSAVLLLVVVVVVEAPGVSTAAIPCYTPPRPSSPINITQQHTPAMPPAPLPLSASQTAAQQHRPRLLENTHASTKHLTTLPAMQQSDEPHTLNALPHTHACHNTRDCQRGSTRYIHTCGISYTDERDRLHA